MRVVVLGAGLLGVTSAYYLQQLGHEVTVVDRHAAPAARARGRADATEFTPAPRVPAAVPGRLGAVFGKLVRALRSRREALRNRVLGTPPFDPVEHLVRLNAYSRETVRALREEAGVQQGARSAGLLNFYLDPKAFEARMARAARLRELGSEAHLLSAQEALRMEPALGALRDKLVGATLWPEDPMRDPAAFASSLVFLCRAAGVRFLTSHTVVALHENEEHTIDHVDVLDADGRPLTLRAHAFVLALGSASVQHASALDIPMPLRFLREYTVTLPIRRSEGAPHMSLYDKSGKLRITRTEGPEGDCLRISAMVRAAADEEFEPDSDRFEAIVQRITQLFPGVTDASKAQFRTHVHAVSANGLPLIGRTRVRNLFVNIASGEFGWVNACGAGKSIARIVSGLRPEVEFSFTGQ